MDQELSRLETLLDQAQSTIETIDAQNALAHYLLKSDIERSLDLAASAENLANREGYTRGLAVAKKNQSHCFHRKGDYGNGLRVGIDALRMFEDLQDKNAQASIVRAMGFMYMEMGDYAKGLEHQLKTLKLYEELNDRFEQAYSITNIGILHSMAGNSQQALEYYNRSLKMYSANEQRTWRARTLNSCCVDYTIIGDYDKAKAYGEEALTAFVDTDDMYGAGVVQSSLGEVDLARRDFGTAVQSFEKALSYFQIVQSDLTSPEALETQLNLGQAYTSLGNTQRALHYIQVVLTHAEKQNAQHFIMKSHQLLARIYEHTGNVADALAHLKLYIEVREKILNAASQRDINNLHIIHATREALVENERQKELRNQDQQHFERLTKIKDSFLHSTTHDIKNPLSVISIATSFLRLTTPATEEKSHEYINMISGAAQKILHLVTSILDLARLEATPIIETKPIALLPWCRDILNGFKVLAEAKQITLSMDVQPHDLMCNCNQERFSQVIDNLLSNAIKYTQDGGKVQLKATKHDGQIQIDIIDNGPGIPDEDIPYVFERFYRVKSQTKAAEGTGLGLSIVKLSVEQHKGTIHVKSKLEEGTTFTILLPE